ACTVPVWFSNPKSALHSASLSHPTNTHSPPSHTWNPLVGSVGIAQSASASHGTWHFPSLLQAPRGFLVTNAHSRSLLQPVSTHLPSLQLCRSGQFSSIVH